MTNTLRRWRLLLAALAAMSLFVAACSSDDDETTDDDTEQTDDGGESTGDEMDDEMDDEDAAGETVAVTAVDYGYEGLPETVAAGSTIELTNESEIELHEFVAVKLPEDEERSVGDLLQLPEEELFGLLLPGLATVVIAPPGEIGFAVEGTGVLEEPGRYLIACFIPVGVDPQVYLDAAAESEGGPPEIEGAGPPHITQGMFAELTVE